MSMGRKLPGLTLASRNGRREFNKILQSVAFERFLSRRQPFLSQFPAADGICNDQLDTVPIIE